MQIDVLNNGFVKLEEHLGGDSAVIRNARRCWRSESKGDEADRKLIAHLIRNEHKSPFEAMVLTFDIKCPIFVARQWFRHRMGSYNEESLRYCVAQRDFYVPANLTKDQEVLWLEQNNKAFDAYEMFVEQYGMKKEQARSLIPLGIYTNFYWTVNGSSLMNFLKLRLDPHAQYEIREYAKALLQIASEKAPMSFEVFSDLVLSKYE